MSLIWLYSERDEMALVDCKQKSDIVFLQFKKFRSSVL